MKRIPLTVVVVSTLSLGGLAGATAVAQTLPMPGAAAQAEDGANVTRAGWREGRGHRHGGRRGAMREMMRQADANGDRQITQEEIDTYVAEKVALGDANTDGALTLDEFRVVFTDVMNRRIVDAFQHLDDDGDAVISAAELDERFGHIVERMDRNGDGVLSRDDRRGRGERGRRGE